MHISLELAFKTYIDFVLFQEPYIASDNRGTVSHLAYTAIVPPPNGNTRPRVAIFARKDTIYSYTARPDITSDPDILIITVLGRGLALFQLINVYNEKDLGDNED